MNKMCLSFLVALLVVLHLLSTQVVQAQTTKVPTVTTTKANMTTTVNKTTTYNGCGRTDALTLLPLAVASSLLSWS
ncbi:hypothetical protein PFLUV_G00236760 [Perca fluviatilis]|uniref:Uncharacterized protein n=1 Tax=Perca fluviatilis TaxID=8168 RepID=A0A6A5EGP9_PERFL|nr:hypothetical protein PFLUV_G00236760 [Perca fluviatilis]